MKQSQLAVWANRIAERDQTCPWPGPRPMRGAEVLNGREDESRTFLQLVGEHRLVILDGKSGVGKSSLLQASLVPALREKKYAVALCTDWSDVGQAAPHDLLGAKIREALSSEKLFADPTLPLLAEFSADAKIFDELEADRNLTGRRTVVILDQFEELIRYSPVRASNVVDVIARLNNRFNLTIVVSLRSEYLHELRRLERMVRAFTYATYQLEPIGDRFALDIITAPNREQKSEISDDAAELIAEIWKEARQVDHERGTSVDEIGLLHLQALLYSLHWANSSRSGPITRANVVGLIEGRPAVVVLETAMVDAVTRKLEECSNAAEDLADPYLLNGARSYVARIAPHLSSGGFKLHREAAEIADQTIEDELNALGARTVAWNWQSLLRSMVNIAAQATRPESDLEVAGADLIGDTWHDLMRQLVDVETADRIRDACRVAAPPDSPSAGVMMGMPNEAILVEELRRLALAMAWMAHTHLVRLSTPAEDRTMISLIHDRFGQGLAAWSKPVRDEPEGPLHAITAPQAAELAWGRNDETTGTPDQARVLANLRWRSAFVMAEFKHVVFVNCDFRGSMFKWCVFEGVAFVNCRLEGTMFQSCQVVGRASAPLDERDDRPSAFALDVQRLDSAGLRESLARYTLADASTDKLFSYLPGRPVQLLDADVVAAGGAKLTAWEMPIAGLVVYGGRVSTFVCRGMTFEGAGASESSMAFRHVAGSGLEIAEQFDSGSYEIFSSAIRHLSITPSHDAADDSMIELTVAGSAVTQAWFGESLSGSATCTDSLLVQVWNNSSDFDVNVVDCLHQGLVGCDVVGGTPLIAGEPIVGVDDLNQIILDRAALMNFVQDPSNAV